ncbi:MAG: glutamate synthase subunit alpha, partial [Candidatus Omnitrophica bacterium]|nr:glutamate synthase subunit alpha [Candidatus Omnitrophota bacterium]
MSLRAPLYNPAEEHDACGVGFVADIEGRASHRILQMGLTCVKCVTHRGAVSADAKTGDGAGIETQLPRRLFRRELKRLGVAESAVERLAVGMCFLPQDPTQRDQAKAIIEHELERAGLVRHGWRHVPVNPKGLGEHAAATQPSIQQVLIGWPEGRGAASSGGGRRPDTVAEDDYERRLYLVRRQVERAVATAGLDCYLPSFSSRTVVYKGLFVAPQLAEFYRDLADPLYETALCVFHQRYSTNTFPNWVLAQPFRMLGHNGEINTLLGNQNWMRAREPELKSPVWGAEIQKLLPVIQPAGSDSAKLDNALELLVMSGFDILHAMTMLVPEAWQQMPVMDPDLRAFYEFQACLSEPWDGPAALAFTDGRIVGATLDRNGLRPARYKVTKDGLVVLGSEVGIVELDDAAVIESGRLGPGKMLAVDTTNKILLTDEVIKRRLAHQRPYGEWLARQMVRAEALRINEGKPALAFSSETWPELTRWQKSFGLNAEDLQLIVKASAATAKEPVGSMGDDAPLAVLSSKPKVLPAYFKQLFAQVTNPPIDPLRERLVMSINTGLGARGSMLEETEPHAKWIKFGSPVLTEPEFQWVTTLADPAFQAARLPVLFPVADGPTGLRPAVERLCRAAESAVDEGKTLLVLSDRGVDPQQAAIPMLMAVGAVHHHLIRQGKRMRCSFLCETGATWDIHHYAALLGYGAAAIFPYLAYATVARLVETKELRELDLAAALHQYKKSVEDGILKIMSKMGISLIASYRGAQIFEAIGLSREVLDLCFTGTACKLTGIGFPELGAE